MGGLNHSMRKNKRREQQKRIKIMLWLGVAIIAIYSWIIPEYVDMFTGTRTIIIYNTPQAHAEGSNLAPATQTAPIDTSVLGTVKRVAKDENIDWKVLYGICLKESGCKIPDCSKVDGACDGYKSAGYFQIHLPKHSDVDQAKASDIEWSARWTAKRLKKYAAIGGWDYAIRKHNGNADIATGEWAKSYRMTAEYLQDVKGIIASL